MLRIAKSISKELEAKIHFSLNKASSTLKKTLENRLKDKAFGDVCYLLGDFYIKNKNEAEGTAWFNEAAKFNHLQAMSDIVEILRTKSTSADHWKALEFAQSFFQLSAANQKRNDALDKKTRTSLLHLLPIIEKEEKQDKEINKKLNDAYYALFELDFANPKNAFDLIKYLFTIKSRMNKENPKEVEHFEKDLQRFREYIIQHNSFKLSKEFDELWCQVEEPENRVTILKILVNKKDLHATVQLADYYRLQNSTTHDWDTYNHYQKQAAYLYHQALSLYKEVDKEYSLKALQSIAFTSLEEKQEKPDHTASLLLCDYELAFNANEFLKKIKQNKQYQSSFAKAVLIADEHKSIDFISNAKRNFKSYDEYKSAVFYLYGKDKILRNRAIAAKKLQEIGSALYKKDKKELLDEAGFYHVSAGDIYLDEYNQSNNNDYLKLAFWNYCHALNVNAIDPNSFINVLSKISNKEIQQHCAEIILELYKNTQNTESMELVLSYLIKDNIREPFIGKIIDGLMLSRQQFVKKLYESLMKNEDRDKDIPVNIQAKLYNGLSKLQVNNAHEEVLEFARLAYLKSEEVKDYPRKEKDNLKEDFLEAYIKSKDRSQTSKKLFDQITLNRHDISARLKLINDRINIERQESLYNEQGQRYRQGYNLEKEQAFTVSLFIEAVHEMERVKDYQHLKMIIQSYHRIQSYYGFSREIQRMQDALIQLNVSWVRDYDSLYKLIYSITYLDYKVTRDKVDQFISNCKKQLKKIKVLKNDNDAIEKILKKNPYDYKSLEHYAEKLNLKAMNQLAHQRSSLGLEYCRKVIVVDLSKATQENLLQQDEILQIKKYAEDRVVDNINQCRLAYEEVKEINDKSVNDKFVTAYMKNADLAEKVVENKQLFDRLLADPADVMPRLRLVQFKFDVAIFCEVIKRISEQKQYQYINEALEIFNNHKTSPIHAAIRDAFEKFDVSLIHDIKSLDKIGMFAMEANLNDLMTRCYERKLELQRFEREQIEGVPANQVMTTARLAKLLDTSGSITLAPIFIAPSAPVMETTPSAPPRELMQEEITPIEGAPSVSVRTE